ncbi:MAG: HipA N-terminal domain-containing protein [Eubacterium sp.]|nr:HipA N-terminal domain-containing protein [Eubacterium sp.]
MIVYRRAKVYIQDRFAGVISENDDGYFFVYDDDYISDAKALAVSITMPLDKKEYHSKTLFPFFDGLIPEGWLLNLAVKNWKLTFNDRFGLLLATCRDCVGDVWVEPED